MAIINVIFHSVSGHTFRMAEGNPEAGCGFGKAALSCDGQECEQVVDILARHS